MRIQDAFEITRGLQAEFNEPFDDDPNRFMKWDLPNDASVKMDQYDGYIYIKDGDATISIPSTMAGRLASILEIADRIAND